MGQTKKSKSNLKAVYIGLMYNDRNEGLTRAFNDKCDKFKGFRLGYLVGQELLKLDFVPDVLFLQIQDGFIRSGHLKYRTIDVFRQALKHLRGKGTKVINWTGDKRNTVERWMFDFSQYVDVTSFSNEEDVNLMRAKGITSEYLQIGIDPEVFKDHGEETETAPIVFMGNYHPQFPLADWRYKVINSVKTKFGRNFDIWGHRYPMVKGDLNADGNNPWPMQSRESRIYNNCKIALSISNYNAERYTSDRTLRIMGSGAFCLCHHYKGIEKDFKVGYHLDTFTDENDCKRKIEYYLEHDDERQEIAKNGFDLIHSEHTYYNMVDDIFKL